MIFDAIPIWALFVGMIVLVIFSLEFGGQLGRYADGRWVTEKESPVSTIAGTVLGLSAFMLAFAFGITWDRYDFKRALVREDASAIRTAWQRSDFLPEPQRADAVKMFRRYVDVRLEFAQGGSLEPARLNSVITETLQIQNSLWDMAVVEARKDMNSDVAALYIESLNDINKVHAERVAIGVQTRVPLEIWIVLISLTMLGMAAVGYHSSIAESRRSLTWPVLALAFGLALGLIASLDRPDSGLIKVSQQPLIDVQTAMAVRSAM